MSSAGATVGWLQFFGQDFYHLWILPLLALTVGLAYQARPSTDSEIPAGFRKFQLSYLSVWGLCAAADWLQGPYVYALYAAYGFSTREIAQLFVAGFGSSLVFGCVVGSVTDLFGRKRTCVMYCILYIASCMTKHFKAYSVLMLGRVTGGIATSMLFSCFECWMVSEHNRRFSAPDGGGGGLLGYMFGMMFTVHYSVAIASGLAGQLVADGFTFAPYFGEGGVFHMGGYCCPFDLAILCLVIAMMLIVPNWTENYGDTTSSSDAMGLVNTLKEAGTILKTDQRALLLGVAVSAFEGSMFAFVFNWTPALNSEETPPPHGVIFALFMMACMCGSSTSTLTSRVAPALRLGSVFGAGMLSFFLASHALASGAQDNLVLSMTSFTLFEYCVGVYFPTVGELKSDIVPERVRGTVYNIYRVPLNAIVVGLLLSDLSLSTCFKLNAVLQLCCLLSMVGIIQRSPTTSGSGASSSSPSLFAAQGAKDIEAATYSAVGQESDSYDQDEPAAATVLGRRRPPA
eukprot:CAMPEP_0206524792 /NCGR_PEP_ID=MMETSP0324_2-20121206/68373_1 /ASSEMBLY_ACC=CAM_ASM_000836 /TAXON_ID=2866 /ORGANISM="Crypthecodinium cohnii, Strain Seligo" /LENGTH=514 /DNA_ID=CAMNT_0054019383 /DNA_START=77 /DNA_END=1617 /DNA_ORIENTATION=-